MGEWLIDFKGRNYSGAYNVNLLWRDKNIFIMDNHKVALWCWMQCVLEGENYDYHHVDAHYDALGSEDVFESVKDVSRLTFDEYLEASYSIPEINGPIDIFKFDNYLSYFIFRHRGIVGRWLFATHHDGDIPPIIKVEEWNLWYNPIIQELTSNRIILNIDLDYFFYVYEIGKYELIFTEEFIKRFFEEVARAIDKGKIAILTISLSPEYCGGWAQAESVLALACDCLGLDFTLPQA